MRKNRISLFADREVNTGRQVFLDLAKVLAIMFMVSVHALLEFACLEDAEGGCGTWGSKWTLRILDDILGGTLSASVFMFAMGVGVMYSRTPDPASHARRGRRLLWKAILMNALRALPFGLVLLSSGSYRSLAAASVLRNLNGGV